MDARDERPGAPPPGRGARRRKARRRAFERLEPRRLLAATGTDDGVAAAITAGACPLCGAGGCRHLTDASGAEFMECFATPAAGPGIAVADVGKTALFPLADTFALRSRPTATKTIYLDFTGHTTSGTGWQGGATFDTPAYSLDTDFANFSDRELAVIQDVWSRVAEDFSPFDVDVTTQEPTVDDLRNTGNGDTRWGIRVVIGGDGAWRGSAGVAYLNSFNWSSDTPCFVFAGQWWKTNLTFVSTAVSHEVGHTLGLRHDGYNGSQYYGGRGTGEVSWGPIMGNPGYVNLTQWSNGDYGGATNTEDDLAIITTRNGFGYRPDDHGNTPAAATEAPGDATFTVSGVIGSRTDTDVIAFQSNGAIDVTISPLAVGANLDVQATILDAAGAVVATSNPLEHIGASFTLTVAPGRYFLAVQGTGMGDPATTGYSAYGSLGQYTATVSRGVATTAALAIEATNADRAEGNTGATPLTFTVTRVGDTSGTSSVRWAVAGGGANTASAGDFVGGVMPSGSLTFAAGETSRTITVNVAGDTTVEADERFTVVLSIPANAVIASASATGVIRNDDVLVPPTTLAIAAAAADAPEGNTGVTGLTFVVTRSGNIAVATTVRWAVTSDGAAATDFAGGVFPSGSLTFDVGEGSRTITVDVAGDTTVELDERFTVTISDAAAATITTATAAGVIRNDDRGVVSPPSLSVAATDADKPEGNAGMTPFVFTVSRGGDLSGGASVSWAVTGSGPYPATVSDFLGVRLPAGRLTFVPGEAAKVIVVPVQGDTGVTPDEQFTLTLSAASGGTLGTATAVGMIRNDDGAGEAAGIAIAAAAADKPEGDTAVTEFTFTVTRSGPTATAASVRWAVSPGGIPAVSAADFWGGVAPSGTVTFGPRETTRQITVRVVGDTIVEGDERFTVTLSRPVNATITSASAVGVIRDDDGRPGAPTGVTATAGDGAVSLRWAAPVVAGSAAISDYVVESSADGGRTWTPRADDTSTSPSTTVSGLTNGVAYVFRVAAVNAFGRGAFSAPSRAVRPAATALVTLSRLPAEGTARLVQYGIALQQGQTYLFRMRIQGDVAPDATDQMPEFWGQGRLFAGVDRTARRGDGFTEYQATVTAPMSGVFELRIALRSRTSLTFTDVSLVAVATGRELVHNGDFRAGLAGWYTHGGRAAVTTTTTTAGSRRT